MTDVEKCVCPVCENHPEIEYIGRSSQPIIITTYVKGKPIPLVSGGAKIYKTTSIYCSIYRCEACNHIEWKAIP